MAKDINLDDVRERRYVVKDILNTNLLSPEARKQYEAEYDDSSRVLAESVKADK